MANTPPAPMKRVWRHLVDYRAAYLVTLIVVSLLAGAVWLGWRNDALARERQSWPVVDALIVSSQVDEDPIADRYQLETLVIIDLCLQFDCAGTARTVSLTRTFRRAAPIAYEKLLAPGQTIQIRFDPKDPNRISLGPLLPD